MLSPTTKQRAALAIIAFVVAPVYFLLFVKDSTTEWRRDCLRIGGEIHETKTSGFWMNNSYCDARLPNALPGKMAANAAHHL